MESYCQIDKQRWLDMCRNAKVRLVLEYNRLSAEVDEERANTPDSFWWRVFHPVEDKSLFWLEAALDDMGDEISRISDLMKLAKVGDIVFVSTEDLRFIEDAMSED